MANFVGPYFVRINYHYVLGPHTMTIPTNVWSPDGGVGTFADWSGGAVPADTMIGDLVTKFLPFFDTNTTFDNWTIFKQLLPADEPVPEMTGIFTGQVGTNTDTKWSAAVEQIVTVRTTNFGIAKLDFLDADSTNNFNPVRTMDTKLTNLMVQWGDLLNGWRGRDNGRPNSFLKMTTNLNQKLRKTYRLD